MEQAAQKTVFTATDYLVWESGQLERHEFLDGEVFAMAGAEDRHVTVSMNLAFALRQHLSGSPCRTFMSDMRLQVAAANSYFYPDVLVTCSALDSWLVFSQRDCLNNCNKPAPNAPPKCGCCSLQS